MFSGIIYSTGIVKNVKKNTLNYPGSISLEIKSKLNIKKKDIGESICCNGVCLTLEKVKKKNLFFYLSNETIARSSFKNIKKGDLINVEKSMNFGQKVSGHYVQGHVDTTGKVKFIKKIGKSWLVDFTLSQKFFKNIVEKASISINGVSLTISKITKNGFQITIIPHTLKLTNLLKLERGSIVNIEFDIFSKYLHNISK